MRHINLLLTLTTSLLMPTVFGQKIARTIDKKDCNVQETISVTYKIKAKIDSVSHPRLDGFTYTHNPRVGFNSYTSNGTTTYKYTTTYPLRAQTTGTYQIDGPVFHINGKTKKAKGFTLTVHESQLTSIELDSLTFTNFKKDQLPIGTKRIIIKNELGYIEVYQGPILDWIFLRKLTKEETLTLEDLK